MTVYKLLRIGKDNRLYPLFINRQSPTPFGEWLSAECFPTKGFAVRKGWHCTLQPKAPHLKMNLANGERRVWVKCEAEDCTEYQRPESQGGTWVLAQKIKLVNVM